ncbi:MAG: CDP-diacylglycerol--serine O-phosphatidyltransferase [Actinomycetota bacterium]|nr:CDP-diacylglycerol--serine O-phosphatidyltransferase [Actinomycetota bacterium]
MQLSNLATSGNLAAGFLSLLLISHVELGWAAVFVVVSGVLDAVDGPVARATGAQSQFGSNLDSLADLVSFGVAPAYATYVGSLHEVTGVGAVVCLGFVLSSAWRLARFPLCKDPHYFVGCPVPVAGVPVMLLAALGPHPFVSLTAVLALSLLMVCTLPVPTFAHLRSLEIHWPRSTARAARRTGTRLGPADEKGGRRPPLLTRPPRPHRSAHRARPGRRRVGRRIRRQRREAA